MVVCNLEFSSQIVIFLNMDFCYELVGPKQEYGNSKFQWEDTNRNDLYRQVMIGAKLLSIAVHILVPIHVYSAQVPIPTCSHSTLYTYIAYTWQPYDKTR